MRAINEVIWKSTFLNTNVNEKVDIFNSTILNIVSNFIPHEVVVCEKKDPPFFSKKRALIQEKKLLHLKILVTSSHIDLKCHLKYLQTCFNGSIKVATEKYYHNTVNKLMNAQKNYRVYWSLLNIFLNNKKIMLYIHCFIKTASCVILRKKSNFLMFSFVNNALLLLTVALFLLKLNILLTNVYLQIHFQTEILEKSLKILIKTKPMDMIN